MNELMTQYDISDGKPKFLYRGSLYIIVKELQAWVFRRRELSQEQMALRERIFDSTLEMKIFKTAVGHDAALAEGVRCLDLAEVSGSIFGIQKTRTSSDASLTGCRP